MWSVPAKMAYVSKQNRFVRFSELYKSLKKSTAHIFIDFTSYCQISENQFEGVICS